MIRRQNLRNPINHSDLKPSTIPIQKINVSVTKVIIVPIHSGDITGRFLNGRSVAKGSGHWTCNLMVPGSTLKLPRFDLGYPEFNSMASLFI